LILPICADELFIILAAAQRLDLVAAGSIRLEKHGETLMATNPVLGVFRFHPVAHSS
jgi:hypothetical protein